MITDPHRYPSAHPAAAFTLVEIMVAMLILSMGVFTTVGLTKWIVRGTDYSARMTHASVHGKDKMEKLLAMEYAQIVSGNDVTNGMTRTWTVTSGVNTKTIVITLQWRGIDGIDRNFTMQDMVSEP